MTYKLRNTYNFIFRLKNCYRFPQAEKKLTNTKHGNLYFEFQNNRFAPKF